MKTAILIFTVILSGPLLGQGCSDAGFCTMGAMKPDQSYSKRVNFKLRTVEYNYYRGETDISPRIIAHQIELNASLNDVNNFQVKIPYMFTKGNLGSNQGFGDISVSFTKYITTWKGGSLNGTIGTKIPTNNSTATFQSENTTDQAPQQLPMYYQTSLGSIDAIAGLSWINSKWLFATGIQGALTENESQFQWSGWSRYPDQEYLQQNHVGRNLKRGTDIMVRVERNFRFTNYNFSLGILPIYRITKDEAYLPASDSREKLDGTTGLALSALIGFGYNIDVRNGVKFIHGHKLTDREINPDGLTRKWVNSFSVYHRF